MTIAGCAAGPDFTRPAPPNVDRYTPEVLASETQSAEVAGGVAQRFVPTLDIPAEWWTLFHSPALNALIEQALKQNPNLQEAQAALVVAQENVAAQRGAFYPSITANFTPSRQKFSTSTSSPSASAANPFNLHTAGVNVSYAADVFGGNRRQVESLQAQAEFQRFQLEAAHLALTSNVVAAALQEAALRSQIAATERIIVFQSQQLDLTRRQFELGASAQAAVVAQQAALAQTQATLPPLQKQLAQQRNLLAALAGRFPSNAVAETFKLESLQLPRDLPVSLPSRLVQQRPDVRACRSSSSTRVPAV
jgi:NodT family efflux transporter outer membrane factor (OMF) lipoprotein